jgi:bifunctional ADP-heptose synthase (sugar kinase/adenylyltransferase)
MEVTEKRLLVAGDIMLDRYWFGDVNRFPLKLLCQSFVSSRKEDIGRCS